MGAIWFNALATSRAYLRHEVNVTLDQTHRHRDNLMKTAKKKLSGIDDDVWAGLDFYYNEIRNDLYHDSAAKTLTDSAILDYEETVLFVLDRTFGVHLSDLVQTALVSAAPAVAETVTPEIDWSRLVSRTDRLLAARNLLPRRRYRRFRLNDVRCTSRVDRPL